MKRLENDVQSVKKSLSEEQLRIKRVSELITAYEKIVEGNYIDSLVRTQREQEQIKTLDKRTYFFCDKIKFLIPPLQIRK